MTLPVRAVRIAVVALVLLSGLSIAIGTLTKREASVVKEGAGLRPTGAVEKLHELPQPATATMLELPVALGPGSYSLFRSDGTVDDLLSFYESALTAQGWRPIEIQGTKASYEFLFFLTDLPSTTKIISFSDGEWQVTITLTGAREKLKCNVLIQVTPLWEAVS